MWERKWGFMRLLDDPSILEWLWHDSVPRSLDLQWSDERHDAGIDLFFRCHLHPDEDWRVLAPYGVTGPAVTVVLKDAEHVAVRGLGVTADRGHVDRWSVTSVRASSGASHHVITFSTGAIVEATCSAVYVSDAAVG